MKRSKKASMAKILLAGISLMLFCVVYAISFSYYTTTRSVIKENCVSNYTQIISQVNRRLSDSVQDVVRLCAALDTNSRFIGEISLARKADTSALRLEHERTVKMILQTAVGYQPYIENIGIFMNDLQLMMYDTAAAEYKSALPGEDWFGRIMAGTQTEAVLPDYQLRRKPTRNNDFYNQTRFVYAHTLNDTRIASDLGVLVVCLKPEYLSELLTPGESAEGAAVYLLDSDCRVICSGGKDALPPLTRDTVTGDSLTTPAGERMLIRVPNETQNWELAALIPEDILYRDLRSLLWKVVSVAAAAMAAGVGMAFLISYIVTKGFKELARAMGRAGSGDLGLSAVNSPIAEVDRLATAYDDMIRQIASLMERSRVAETAKHRAELAALRNQINPHFLYNTLDSIRWMAMMQQAPKTAEMVSALAKLLRLIASQKGDTVSVEEEFAQVRLYAQIIRFRYNSRVQASFFVREGLADARTLGLILQPIVENSFEHGFPNPEQSGNIRVSADADGRDLVFTVEDDGLGAEIPEGALPKTASRDGKRLHAGVGIENVHERLSRTYGAGYGLVFRSRAGGHTVVTLRQPLFFNEDSDQAPRKEEDAIDSGHDRGG